MNLKVIALDADDTLWINEPYFQETERKFCALLEDFLPHHTISQELFKIEIQNLPLYGYGVKGFMLCMVETALKVSGKTVTVDVIEQAIQYGKELLDKPIELLEGVEAVLQELSKDFKLVVATKGDLLDQEKKLKKSGIEHYFHHTEIMSNKRATDYLKLIKHLDIRSDEFMMIGNSIKSDVLPVLEIGGYAVHVPYHTTWAHEQVTHNINQERFKSLTAINEIITYLQS